MVNKYSNKPSIAIIGAGMTGLTCAQILNKNHFHCTVYDKSRGLGGRMATRRIDQTTSFDHGAQYITATNPDFQRYLSIAQKNNSAHNWKPRILPPKTIVSSDWVVGAPQMNSLFSNIITDKSIQLSSKVSSVRRNGKRWLVRINECETQIEYDIVILAIPAPQAALILEPTEGVSSQLKKIKMNPCWTLMLAFDAQIETGFDVWQQPSKDISWIAHNGTKLMRPNEKCCWVIHSSALWAQQKLGISKTLAVDELCNILPKSISKHINSNTFMQSHLWRFAFSSTILKKAYCSTKDYSLLAGGDWALGKKVEHAFVSGSRMANTIIKKHGNK
jgi:renalase